MVSPIPGVSWCNMAEKVLDSWGIWCLELKKFTLNSISSSTFISMFLQHMNLCYIWSFRIWFWVWIRLSGLWWRVVARLCGYRWSWLSIYIPWLKKGKKISSDSLCKWLYAPDLYIKTDAGHFYRNLHSMLNWDTCWVFGIFILHILVYFSFLSASIHLQYIVNSIPQFNNVERNNCIFYCGK